MSALCSEWSDQGEGRRSGRGSLRSGSDSARSLQINLRHRLGGPGTSRATNPLTGTLPGRAACRASSTASTASTGSYQYRISSTTRAESGVSSDSPRNSASSHSAGAASESSTDPILLHLALHSASPERQISSSSGDSTLSSSTVDSRDADTESEGSNVLDEDELAGTPNTSETSPEDEPQPPVGEVSRAPTLNRELLLAGLNFPKEFRHTLLSSDTNIDSDDDDDDLNIETLGLHTNSQASPDAASWVPSIDIVTRCFDPVGIALAPPAGPAYDALHSPTRKYVRVPDEFVQQREGNTARFQRQFTPSGSRRGSVAKSNWDVLLLAQTSENGKLNRHPPSQNQYNIGRNLECFPAIPKSQICRPVYSISDSLLTQVSTFYPCFLVSHLSEASVSALTAQLCGPNGPIYGSEYDVYFSLGFGPHICLPVTPFSSKDKEGLRSFQKQAGNDKLDVNDSLPIALNLFSVESTAETLDVWLDGIVDSNSYLSEYMNLMMGRHTGNLSAKNLQEVVSWFLEPGNKLESPHKTLRIALKLLLTTSVLTLVPKITYLPPLLSSHLSLHSSSGGDSAIVSLDAPKLLTRQVKYSTHHLQKKLLHALFFDLFHASQLVAEIRLAVVLIISFVLELVRNAGREFAKYANKINPTVFVGENQVKDYERNLERVVFDRVRAGICDYPRGDDGRMGDLGHRLRRLNSSLKGKGKEDENCRFVSAVLAPVL